MHTAQHMHLDTDTAQHTHTHTHNLCTEHSTTQTHTHKVQHTEHTCQGVLFETVTCSVMSGHVSWFLDVLCDVKMCSVTSCVCVLWHHDVFCDVRVCSLIPWCTLCFQDVVCYTLMPLFLCPQGLTFTQWGRCSSCVCHRPARSFLFCSCVRFCLYGPFKLISFHKFSWQLSPSPLGSPGLISASSALSTMYLCMIVSFSPDIIVLSFMVDWAPSIN